MAGPETACSRSYFYVGGTYVDDDGGERVMQGQMYVEHLAPVGGTRHALPLVFIHGGAQTGSNWLNTPDGRKGWASYFLDHGYSIYLIDSPTRGRSAWQPSSDPVRKIPVSFFEQRFTAVAEYNLWPQAHLHTQWPGTGHPGDPTFDAYFASTVQWLTSHAAEQRGLQAAGAALLDRIGPAILLTHSQGGPPGWLIADARPALVKAIIALEPAGPPFAHRTERGTVWKPYGITDLPLTFDPPLPASGVGGDDDDDDGVPLRTTSVASPPEAGGESWILQAEPARKLAMLRDTRVVVVTAEASFHAAYDECTVRFLRQAGVGEVEWIRLDEHGIRGNGHMMFMELNNLEVAKLLESRIAMIA